MRRLFAVPAMAFAVAAVILAGGPAYAGQNANGSISVSPSRVPSGGVVHISGSVSTQGCPVSDSATIVGTDTLFPPDGFGPAVARDSQGAFATTYTVPASTPAGTYQIGLRCGGGNVGVTAALTVTDAPIGAPATSAGGTARGPSRPWTLLGVGCLALAGVLFGARRRLATSVR